VTAAPATAATRPDREGRRKAVLRSTAVGALIVALVASVGGNLYLVHATESYVDMAEAIRLDPGGLKTYASDRANAPADFGGGAPKNHETIPLLLFFGDSRALMWSAPTTPTGYRVVNRGIGNQTTAQMLLRFDADVTPLHPAVIVLEGGVNDLKAIAEFPAKRAEIVADCEANLERLVEQCRKTGATVVLVTVFEIGEVAVWRRPFWSNDVSAAVREVNAFLPRLAGPKIVLFDANPVLRGGRGEIQPDYQLDHLHLSSAGYLALNEKLVPLLASLPR
jgi:lysophospholipase L1-like esterase